MPDTVKKIDTTELKSRIPGWGADLDPKSRPGIPRERNQVPAAQASFPKLTQQKPPHRIHISIERPGITPVFGTSVAPRGLSGKIRDLAYSQWGEGRTARWVTLLLADRIDVVEGIFEDFLKGKIPNPFSEIGLIGELHDNGRLKWWRGNPKTGRMRLKQAFYIALGAGLVVGVKKVSDSFFASDATRYREAA